MCRSSPVDQIGGRAVAYIVDNGIAANGATPTGSVNQTKCSVRSVVYIRIAHERSGLDVRYETCVAVYGVIAESVERISQVQSIRAIGFLEVREHIHSVLGGGRFAK